MHPPLSRVTPHTRLRQAEMLNLLLKIRRQYLKQGVAGALGQLSHNRAKQQRRPGKIEHWLNLC
jgi:hypothetical protein